MLELLDQIDKAKALSPGKAAELLGVKFDLVPTESNEYLAVFRGHGGVWKEAELRLPPTGNGGAFVLVLRPAEALPMKAVTDHFGEHHALDQPNPAAGDQGSFGYVYERAKGSLRFSFRSFQDYNATVILFDRMQAAK